MRHIVVGVVAAGVTLVAIGVWIAVEALFAMNQTLAIVVAVPIAIGIAVALVDWITEERHGEGQEAARPEEDGDQPRRGDTVR